MKYRHRIIAHRKVKAADIKPHPLNWRTHPDNQRAAVTALYAEVGEARSVLAYEDPEWGLTLIDGHGRREWLPDQELTVEVLDVTRDEARKLLLSMDPLAMLAGKDEAALAELRRTTEADNAVLNALWDSLGQDEDAAAAAANSAHDAG